MIKRALLIIFSSLSLLQLHGQATPEAITIEKGGPVPPFFLQSLSGTWQSSERAFNKQQTLLCFVDLLQLDTLQLGNLSDITSDSLSVYLIDTNPYFSIEKRKAIYRELDLKLPVLFDVKRFLYTAYQVQEQAVWFLVDREGILLDFDQVFTKDRLRTL